MKPKIEKLCGIRSNCEVCRAVPEHRKAIGWPDKCPRGITIESLPKAVALRAKCRRPCRELSQEDRRLGREVLEKFGRPPWDPETTRKADEYIARRALDRPAPARVLSGGPGPVTKGGPADD